MSFTNDKCGDSIRVLHPLFQVGDGGSIPTSPLQLDVVSISNKRAAKLNALWHSSMPLISSWAVCKPCFVAVYQNRIYAVAMWSYPIAANRIKNGEYMLELRRLAIAEDAPRNTASRMLSVMTKLIKRDMPQVFQLISYQDTEHHHGTIYKASGWEANGPTEYISWGLHSQRPGRIEQSKAPKIRWHKSIRKLCVTEEQAKTQAQQLCLGG